MAPSGGGRGEHLGHGVDRETGQRSELQPAHVQGDPEQRQTQHGDHAEHGGEGDGRGYVLAVRPDHRGHGGDGGVAADGVAAGHQRRHPVWEPEQPAHAVAGGDRASDHGGDADQERRPGGEDGRRADRGAKQHHGDLQQHLGAEVHPRAPAGAGRPGRADDCAHQDRQDQALQPGAAEQAMFQALEEVGRERDENAQADTRQHPRQRAPDLAHGEVESPGRVRTEHVVESGEGHRTVFRLPTNDALPL